MSNIDTATQDRGYHLCKVCSCITDLQQLPLCLHFHFDVTESLSRLLILPPDELAFGATHHSLNTSLSCRATLLLDDYFDIISLAITLVLCYFTALEHLQLTIHSIGFVRSCHTKPSSTSLHSTSSPNSSNQFNWPGESWETDIGRPSLPYDLRIRSI